MSGHISISFSFKRGFTIMEALNGFTWSAAKGKRKIYKADSVEESLLERVFNVYMPV